MAETYRWYFDHKINYGEDAKLNKEQKRRMVDILHWEGYVRACDNLKDTSVRAGREFQDAQKELNKLTLRQKPEVLWKLMVRESENNPASLS